VNKINDKLRFFSDYFKGFQDIRQHTSAKQVGLGVLKIASYATLLGPIIFGIGYLVTDSKKNKLSNLLNRVSLSLKPDFKGEKPTQKEYIKYIASKILDNDHDNVETVFSKITPESQGIFFAKMAKKDKFIEAVKKLPAQTKHLEFNLGKFLGFSGDLDSSEFDKANELTIDFIKELPRFKDAEKICVDLRGIAYYSRQVEIFLEILLRDYRYPFFTSSIYPHKIGTDSHDNGFIVPNNCGAAHNILHGLCIKLKEYDALKTVEIQFINHTITLRKEAVHDQGYVIYLNDMPEVIEYLK
jgi:hypothetical protein